MFHAAQADERVRELRHLFAGAPDNDNFQAVPFVEMHMHTREDLVVMVVLSFEQFVRQPAHCVVVHENDRAYHLTRRTVMLPLVVDEVITESVSNCFRSGTVSLFGADFIEVVQQRLGY